MFAGFNLTLDRYNFENMISTEIYSFEQFKAIGRTYISQRKSKCEENLKNYVLNGVTDGTKLADDWFPQIDADIFISHSHKDEDLALALAGWLYNKFELKCFIDSCVWGYIDDLLEMINKEYSERRPDKEGGYVYNHKKCNIAASHVNMMLCMALQKMIDKTEAVFVVNTENSIMKYGDVYETATFSPWIYSEIVCTQIVRNKELSKYRSQKIIKYAMDSTTEINSMYQSAYNISLDHLKDIKTTDLINWEQRWRTVNNKSDRYGLDELYKITYPDKVKKMIEFHNRIALG